MPQFSKESTLANRNQENEGWGIAVGFGLAGFHQHPRLSDVSNGNVQVQVGSVDISGINSGFVQIIEILPLIHRK